MTAKINWHADGEGRCHAECEAFGGHGSRAGCGLLDVLPWEVFTAPSPAKRSPCPFAVLADVFRLHERPGKETP